jgi:hypothetical protein
MREREGGKWREGVGGERGREGRRGRGGEKEILEGDK